MQLRSRLGESQLQRQFSVCELESPTELKFRRLKRQTSERARQVYLVVRTVTGCPDPSWAQDIEQQDKAVFPLVGLTLFLFSQKALRKYMAI